MEIDLENKCYRIKIKPDTDLSRICSGEAQFITVCGAVTTEERFAYFTDSIAHICDGGIIKRYGREIGTINDIEFTEEYN